MRLERNIEPSTTTRLGGGCGMATLPYSSRTVRGANGTRPAHRITRYRIEPVPDDDLDRPNCPRDLVAMEPTEMNGVVVWRCPLCGLVKM